MGARNSAGIAILSRSNIREPPCPTPSATTRPSSASRCAPATDTAVAYYRLEPGVITFTHTEVPAALWGQGIGSRLIRGALEAARADGLKVVARCSFVSAYLRKHPEFNDMVRAA